LRTHFTTLFKVFSWWRVYGRIQKEYVWVVCGFKKRSWTGLWVHLFIYARAEQIIKIELAALISLLASVGYFLFSYLDKWFTISLSVVNHFHWTLFTRHQTMARRVVANWFVTQTTLPQLNISFNFLNAKSLIIPL
jgi:hypothetical protein